MKLGEIIAPPDLTCSCATLEHSANASVHDEILEIRQSCPALKHILLPPELISRFQELKHLELEGDHDSKLAIALLRSYLSRVTSPIHRYLLVDGDTHPDLVESYKRDLGE